MFKNVVYDRLILVASPDISRGVYESHVISLLESLKNNYNVKLGLITFGKYKLSKEEKGVLEKRENILNNLIGKENMLILNKREFLRFSRQKQIIESFINHYKTEKICLFCQNYYIGFLGSLIKKELKKVHLHVDLKGIVPEEHLFYDDTIFVKRLLLYIGSKIYERYIFKYADSFSAVSNNLKLYFQKRYNIAASPFLVLPSAVNTDKFYYDKKTREDYRKKLGCDDKDVIITYSGSFQEWQQPKKIFEFFKRASNYKNYKFLVLTFDVEKAEKLSKEYNLPEERIKIFASSPIEVNSYLNASDICLLLRKDDIVNNVASPTKFGEYLVTKNMIIITKGVGDFSDLVANSQYGLCLDNLNLDMGVIIKRIEKKRKPTDEEINEFKSEYSLERNIEKLGEIIGNTEKLL